MLSFDGQSQGDTPKPVVASDAVDEYRRQVSYDFKNVATALYPVASCACKNGVSFPLPSYAIVCVCVCVPPPPLPPTPYTFSPA